MCKSVLFCANGFATGFAKKFMATLKPFLAQKRRIVSVKNFSFGDTLDRIPDPCENLPCSGELEFPDVPNRQTQIEKAI